MTVFLGAVTVRALAPRGFRRSLRGFRLRNILQLCKEASGSEIRQFTSIIY